MLDDLPKTEKELEAVEESMTIKDFQDFIDECESWWMGLDDVLDVAVDNVNERHIFFSVTLCNGKEFHIDITEG